CWRHSGADSCTPPPLLFPYTTLFRSASGVLVTGVDHVDLPLCAGAPFLLAFAVPPHADPLDLLAPRAPMVAAHPAPLIGPGEVTDRKSTRLNSSHVKISYAVFCLKKK